MLGKLMFSAVVAVFVSCGVEAVAQEKPIPSGDWVIRDNVSALDGRRTLTAIVFARGHKPADPDDWSGRGLVFRCQDGELTAALSRFGWFDGQTKVNWRSAGGALVTEYWDGSERFVMQRDPVEARRLLGALSPSGGLVVRIDDTYEAEFSLKGVEGIQKKFGDACPP